MRWNDIVRVIVVTVAPRRGCMLGAPVLRSALRMSAVPACAAVGVYKPRRPQASPLFRLVSDHFRAFHAAYEERFAQAYGDWRRVVRDVADKFLECGVDHGFALVRCGAMHARVSAALVASAPPTRRQATFIGWVSKRGPMAEPKTKKHTASVRRLIATVDDPVKHRDAQLLCKMMARINRKVLPLLQAPIRHRRQFGNLTLAFNAAR